MKYKIRVYAALLVLAIPAILSVVFPMLSGDSKIELRKLQDFPSFPKTQAEFGSWPRQFDQFASDRFPLRTDLIEISSNILCSFDTSISPEVFIGSEGWLYLNKDSNVLTESRGVAKLTPAEVAQWTEKYIQRKEQLRERGVEMLLVIVPNKHTIYPQFMPEWNFAVGPTITDQIVSQLDEHQTTGIIDLRSSLKEKAKTELIYGRYNTHWNDRGAYFGYREIIKNIPSAKQILHEQLIFEKKQVTGDLSRLISQPEWNEESQVLNMKKSNLVIKKDLRASGPYDLVKGFTTETSHPDLPSAIFLCDSFTGTYLYKYLAPSFHRALFIHHQSMGIQHQKLVDEYQPNYVVYIIVERLIPYRLY
jgi:alginate O-acetyltransferase complex protein AlgJ